MARPSLTANIATSGVNVLVGVGASLVAVPLLIDRLGLAAYGVWTLAQVILVYVTTAELGFGPALARFTSVHAADPHKPRQVLLLALGLYVAAGLAVALVCHLLARPLVEVFSVPGDLRADAVQTVGLVGWATMAALIAGALGHVLTGLERFGAFTWSNVVGLACFLVALAVLTSGDARLQDAAYAALLQWSVVTALRLLALRRVALGRGPRLPGRGLVRDLWRFSLRLQMAALSTLLNTQTDRVIVGAVSAPTTLGQVGVATQVAEGARFLAQAAVNPMTSRMAVTFGSEGQAALDALLQRLRRLWLVGLLGAVAVGVGAVRPAIAAWLGPGFDEAALYAGMLIVGYGVGLVPTPMFAYLRARGSPGLEGVFGVLTVVVNLAASIVLGVLVGAVGVIAATALAYVVSTVWVMRRAPRLLPRPTGAPISLPALGAGLIAAGLLTYAAGEALVAVAPRGVALAGVAAAVTGIFLLYLMALAGLRPAGLLRTLRAERQAAG